MASLLAGFLLLAGARVAAQDVQKPEPPVLTLTEALEQARKFSPDLKASKEKIAQARAQVTQAWTMMLPVISAQGNYMRADKEIAIDFGGMNDLYALAMANCFSWDEAAMGRPKPSLCDTALTEPSTDEEGDSARVIQEYNNWDASVTIGMSLLNARTFPLLKNMYTGRELAELQAAFSEELLLFSVVQLYYGVSTAQAAAALLAENLATTMRHMELTEIRRQNGVALANERIRAAMAVVQARNNLEQANMSVELTRRSLAIVIGRDESAPFRVEEFPDNPWSDQRDEAMHNQLLARRKDVLMLDKLETMADRLITDVKMKWVPSLWGGWTYSMSSATGFSGEHTSWRGIVSLSWNILEGGRRFYELDEARSRKREAAYKREAALLRARTEVERARTAIDSAKAQLSTSEEMLELAAENLGIVEKQYKLGVADQATILDAGFQLRSSRIQALQGRLRLALAQVALAQALGVFDANKF